MTAASWPTTFKSALIALAVALSVPAEVPDPEPGPADVRAPLVEAHPLADPCPPDDDLRARAECWIEAGYDLFGGPKSEIGLAVKIAGHESGWRPLACNGDNGVSPPKGSCRRTGASGLFQHLPKYWPGRAAKAAERLGHPGYEMDIWNGWHNVLVSISLAGGSSWRTHWQVCDNFTGPGSGSVSCRGAGGMVAVGLKALRCIGFRVAGRVSPDLDLTGYTLGGIVTSLP